MTMCCRTPDHLNRQDPSVSSVQPPGSSARILGPEHPDTLRSRGNLAIAYDAAGQHARAAELHEQNLAVFERVLGSEHPDTLSSRNNLGLAYHAAGDYRRAAELHEQNLAARERVLGPEHPDTLKSRDSLHRARTAAGLDDEQRT